MAGWWAGYIRRRARQLGLDPEAVLAVAGEEGLHGGVGDGGHAFGPFQENDAGGVLTGRPGNHRAYAESRQGIDDALNQIAKVARGEHGARAIIDIVRRFERPANPGKEIAGAEAHYGGMAQLGLGSAAPQAAPQAAPAAGSSLDRGLLARALIQQIGEHRVDVPELVRTATVAAPAAAPSAPASQPSRSSGGFVFPVQGGGQFSNDWGNYRADIPGHHHEGTDVFARRGTPVVAVQDGVVTKMGPSAIGGNRLWINGRFYYAHLDGYAQGIRPGVHVRAGQVLGFVGNTGDAAGGPTHLHFGWSPNGSQGASWANPYPLLKRSHR